MDEVKCLKCSGDVKEMIIESQSDLYLSDHHHFITFLRKNSKLLTNRKIGSGFHALAPFIKVYYCEKCQLIWHELDKL